MTAEEIRVLLDVDAQKIEELSDRMKGGDADAVMIAMALSIGRQAFYMGEIAAQLADMNKASQHFSFGGTISPENLERMKSLIEKAKTR